MTLCGALRGCLEDEFNSCNSLLSSVHTLLVNGLPCVRLYIKNENIIIIIYRGENGVASASKNLCCSIVHHDTFMRSPCCTQSVWWTTESSPVYASPRGEDPEGRMTELVNVSEMVSREKHPREGNGKPPQSMCQENCYD